MPYPLPERNKKISTLIKWFVERKKGKVVAARKEIQRRFDYLDWEDQKKIILAFLNSGAGMMNSCQLLKNCLRSITNNRAHGQLSVIFQLITFCNI